MVRLCFFKYFWCTNISFNYWDQIYGKRELFFKDNSSSSSVTQKNFITIYDELESVWL